MTVTELEAKPTAKW